MGKGLPRSLARAKGKDAIKVERIKLNHTVNVAAAGAGVGFGTVVIGDFPEGNILFLGAVGNAKFTTADTSFTTTFDGDWAVGTEATADADFGDTNEANIISSTAMGAATDRVGPTSRGENGTSAILNNTDGSLELNLNVLIDAAAITDAESGDMTVTGDLWVAYAVLGDD